MSKKAHEILVQDVPWAFAIGTGFSVVMRDNIDGFIWRLNNWVDTRDLGKRQRAAQNRDAAAMRRFDFRPQTFKSLAN
jgi:hypothetical protein